ncbi:aminotransferase class V-fold PLP-dependent enzyme [Microbacterium sp. MC2]
MTDLDSYLASFSTDPGYLNWAAYGPLSPAVRDEALADAELLGTGRASGIDLVAGRSSEAQEVLAELLGAPVDEVTLQPSTTHGLQQAMFGLSGEVLVSPREFPAIPVTARRAQDARGRLTVRELPAPGPDVFVTPEAVRDALTDDITAVAVSLVDFRTGYLADLTALRDVIGDRLLIVDAIQGFGVVDADWSAADVVCGNGYKWLRAGRGTGFAWFSPDARERIEPVLSGTTGMAGDVTSVGVPDPRTDAQAYTVSPVDALAAARLVTALREVAAAGVAAIAAEVHDRAEHVIALADRYDVPVVTPREHHAGIVTLAPVPHEAGAIAAALANHGVAATAREGMLRISPHAGTAADSFVLLGDALASVAARRGAVAGAPELTAGGPTSHDTEN